MPKRKKKNVVTLLSLLLVLIILIGAYLWYGNWKETSKQSETGTEEGAEGSIALGKTDTSKVKNLHFIYEDTDVIFQLENDTWTAKGDPNRPINQDKVRSLLSMIDEIKADRLVVENPEDPSEYGLSEPVSYLEATLQDGVTVTLQIGDEAAGGAGYYGFVNGDKKVYLLGSSYGSGLQSVDADFTVIEEGPTITSSNIRHIEIDHRDKEDFDLLFQQDNKLDYSGTSMNPWILRKPYEEGYLVDMTKVNDILSSYCTFDYAACVDYDSKDLSEYGLEEPLASVIVNYNETRTETPKEPEADAVTGEEITEKTLNEEKKYQIYIGDKNDSGYYYIRTEGSNAVYTMSESTVDAMLSVDPFSLINPLISFPNIDTVDKVDIELEGVPYTMEIERTTKKNENGEEITSAQYYYNGNTVAEDSFKQVYQNMIAAKYDSEVKEAVSTEELKPYMTISYHVNKKNETLTASYLPYNESFYLVDTGSQIRFLAEKRSIDQIANTIKKFRAPEE